MENLLFLHMPKTGGRAVESWLDLSYPEERSTEVLPDSHWTHQGNSGPVTITDALADIARPGGRFIHGHAPFHVFRALRRPGDIMVTLLRDPESRIVSLYRFLRGRPELVGKAGHSLLVELACTMSFERFVAVEHPGLAELSNRQSSFLTLGKDLSGAKPTEILLHCKEALSEFDVVGDYAHFNEFCTMVAISARVLAPGKLHTQNASRTPSVEVTREARAIIQERNAIDAALYDEAAARAARAFDTLISRLIDANAIEQQARKDASVHWRGSPGDGFNWDFSMPCQGRNWANYENPQGLAYRFSGKGDAEIVLPAPPFSTNVSGKSLSIRIRIIHTINTQALDHVTFLVNGRLISSRRTANADEGFYFHLECPSDVVLSSRTFLLTLRNSIAFRPVDIDPENGDQRTLGIAIHGLQISVIP